MSQPNDWGLLMENPQQMVPPITSQQQPEMRMRAAERAHDDNTAFGKDANSAAVKNAEEAIKAAILINGGSSIAMLAFIGTLVTKDFLQPAQIDTISWPLIWFASGVGTALIAAAAAYSTNLFIAGSANRKENSYEHPFVRGTAASRSAGLRGEIARWIGIVAFIGSMICFGRRTVHDEICV